MTQNERILNYLRSGKTLTVAKGFRLFGARRLAGRIAELRAEGYPIYNNGGSYRLGTPSRKMIATAYRVAGSSLFQ